MIWAYTHCQADGSHPNFRISDQEKLGVAAGDVTTGVSVFYSGRDNRAKPSSWKVLNESFSVVSDGSVIANYNVFPQLRRKAA